MRPNLEVWGRDCCLGWELLGGLQPNSETDTIYPLLMFLKTKYPLLVHFCKHNLVLTQTYGVVQGLQHDSSYKDVASTQCPKHIHDKYCFHSSHPVFDIYIYLYL